MFRLWKENSIKSFIMKEGTVTISIEEYDRLRTLEKSIFKLDNIYTVKTLGYHPGYDSVEQYTKIGVYKIPDYSIITTDEIIKDLILKNDNLLDQNKRTFDDYQEQSKEHYKLIKELSKKSIWEFMSWKSNHKNKEL